MFGFDVRIEGNVATHGGGVALIGGESAPASLCLGRARDPESCFDHGGAPPSGAVPCDVLFACNAVMDNVANGNIGGSAILRYATSGTGPVPVLMSGTRLERNTGRSVVGSLGASVTPGGTLALRDTQIAFNIAGNALVDGVPPGLPGVPPEASHQLGAVEIERCTVAENQVGASYVIATRSNLTLTERIVYQPGTTVHAGNASGVFARHVLANEIATLPVRPDIVAGDPMLLSSGEDELRPAASSIALDFSNYPADGLDLTGAARGQDLPEVPNRFGPRDLGAFEQRAPPIFSHDFE